MKHIKNDPKRYVKRAHIGQGSNNSARIKSAGADRMSTYMEAKIGPGFYIDYNDVRKEK